MCATKKLREAAEERTLEPVLWLPKKGTLTWQCHDMIYDWVSRAKLQVGTVGDGLRKPGKTAGHSFQ